MGDVRVLGQDGMSRLPWIPWDTSCIHPTPPFTAQRFTASQFNIWNLLYDPNMWGEGGREGEGEGERELNVSLLVNRQIF